MPCKKIDRAHRKPKQYNPPNNASFPACLASPWLALDLLRCSVPDADSADCCSQTELRRCDVGWISVFLRSSLSFCNACPRILANIGVLDGDSCGPVSDAVQPSYQRSSFSCAYAAVVASSTAIHIQRHTHALTLALALACKTNIADINNIGVAHILHDSGRFLIPRQTKQLLIIPS